MIKAKITEWESQGLKQEATMLKRFLKEKELMLSLADADWNVESFLESIGIKGQPVRNGNFCIFRLKGKIS